VTATPLRLWLIGRGIDRSPSPAMQQAALRACGIAGTYEIVDVVAAALPEVIGRLRGGEAGGANVTVPHKRAVAAACDRLEGDALSIGAVNTVVVEQGRLVGANTDAAGFEGALRTLGLWPKPATTAVVIGAGGAAAAVVLALGRVPVDRVVVAARRPEQAAAFEERLNAVAAMATVEWGSVTLRPLLASADVVVNATPAPLEALPLDVGDLNRQAIVVDLRYRPRPVDLVAAASAAGLRACDGLEMLLHQGMLSFRRWTGVEPPWDEARAALVRAVEA
jgi:shikimate dehydrogenase